MRHKIEKYFNKNPDVSITAIEDLAGIDRLQEFLNGEDTLDETDQKMVLITIELIRTKKIKLDNL